MNLLNFISQFPDEERYVLRYKSVRDSVGVICSVCKSTEHRWNQRKWLYECTKCGNRATLRSRTALHGSRLPFSYWFVAMHLITSTKNIFSALELQRQLVHKRYEPIWAMLNKLREVMGRREEEYQLTDVVELDEGFFLQLPANKKTQTRQRQLEKK